jgi:hypothetical protein
MHASARAVRPFCERGSSDAAQRRNNSFLYSFPARLNDINKVQIQNGLAELLPSDGYYIADYRDDVT